VAGSLVAVDKNTRAFSNLFKISVAQAFKQPLKHSNMKTFGIVLIVIGIAMIVFRGFSVQTEKKVVDLGPLEVNKKENKWIGWPTYAGGIAIIAGLVMVISDRKRTA
jgi:hypothetical protein